MIQKALLLVFISLSFALAAEAESLRLCSQNLYKVDGSKTDKQELARVKRLARRVVEGRCDVIAAQELAATNLREAKLSAELFKQQLEEVSGQQWQAIVAGSRDRHIRNGIFVKQAAANVINYHSLERTVLPSLQPHGPVTYYSRGPLRVELAVRGIEEPVIVYSFHFKSKAHGWRDPAKLDFESWRIEMAEALRRDAALSSGIVVLMGDRNTRHDSASAKVLTGELRIDDFKERRCSVKAAPDLRPDCQATKKRRVQFVPMIERGYRKQLKRKEVGSYKFRGSWELIDDILVAKKSLSRFSRQAYLLGQGDGASDHLLLAVDLEIKESKHLE